MMPHPQSEVHPVRVTCVTVAFVAACSRCVILFGKDASRVRPTRTVPMKPYRVVLCATFVFAAAAQAQNQVVLNPTPARAVGQQQLMPLAYAPNLVEGKEFNGPQAVAVDASRNILYVSDTGNNRVLAWSNASSFGNGSFADAVIGQRDKASVDRLGPGTYLSTGLNTPAGIAVDSKGNLWVVDTGNNRILRYSSPLANPAQPDRVIGQDNFNGRNANSGSQTVSRRGINVNTSNSSDCQRCLQNALAFDAQGNLWFTDAGNNRVLRYPAGSLDQNNPDADLVLGQPDFSSSKAPQGQTATLDKTLLNAPSSLAFDSLGNLFVADSINRVIVYRGPVTAAKAADRIMGVVVVPQGQPAPPLVNPTSFNASQSNGSVGVFAIDDVPFVVDPLASRILRFDPLASWPAESTSAISPTATALIGQDSFTASPANTAQLARLANRGRPEASIGSLALPSEAVFANGEVFVADTGNNRVLALPNLKTGPTVTAGPPYEARRVLGQVSFEFNAVNMIEGKEMFSPGGVALDKRSDPPRLFVADTGNNRILGYRDARRVRPGDYADLVIGQPDFRHAVPNYPTADPNRPTKSNLWSPTALAIDSDGNLWVADSGNGRVLRFPRPFDHSVQEADLVLGKPDFFSPSNTDVNQMNMVSPAGLAFTGDGHLLVSDASLNRVLYFRKESLGNGVPATNVVGQADFNSAGSGSTSNRMNSPRQLTVDSDDRLYVADSKNNRVLIFDRITIASAGVDAAMRLDTSVNAGSQLNNPVSVAVSQTTGEIWITDWNSGGRLLKYPRFADLNPIAANVADPQNILSSVYPQGISFDGYGNLFVADSANRVSIYFQAMRLTNGANFARAKVGDVGGQRVVAGSWMSIFSLGSDFATDLSVASTTPALPNTLADTQVLLNNQPVPIYVVSPRQINFVVPWGAPDSGVVELQVLRPSTQQILAVGCTTVQTAGANTADPGDDRFACMDRLEADVASPAFFTFGGGTGQVAAVNQDGTINGPGAAAARRGDVISLYATGQGKVPNAPADGAPASGLTPTVDTTEILIGTGFVPAIYSGLAPGAIGLWQINVKIPDTVPPSDAVPVVIRYRSRLSNLQNAQSTQNPNGISATIAVK